MNCTFDPNIAIYSVAPCYSWTRGIADVQSCGDRVSSPLNFYCFRTEHGHL